MDVRLNELLNKRSTSQWFETPFRSYDVIVMCFHSLAMSTGTYPTTEVFGTGYNASMVVANEEDSDEEQDGSFHSNFDSV